MHSCASSDRRDFAAAGPRDPRRTVAVLPNQRAAIRGLRERTARPHRRPGLLSAARVPHRTASTLGCAAVPGQRQVPARQRLCRADVEDLLRRSHLWPAVSDVAGRRQRLVSARRGPGTDPRSVVAVGEAMGRTPGDAHEFQSDANGVQGGAELGAGPRDHRASGARHGTRGGAVHEAIARAVRRWRGSGDRSRWQVSAHRHRNGVGEASRQAEAAPWVGLHLRLPTSPGPSQTGSAWQQETTEKRRQEQEWQGSQRGSDVHAEAWRRTACCTGR